MIKKYLIGTSIKYITRHEWVDLYDKRGKIVDIINGRPLIYLPEAIDKSCFHTKERPATIQCGWEDIIPLENVQLLFNFMSDSLGEVIH